MFGKKSSGSGKQDDGKVKKLPSFAYEIPPEAIDANSDWGRPNFDNANSYTTQLRFKQLLSKLHVILYSIIGILLISCVALTFVLVFFTEYEIAYVDDGSALTCRVD